MDKTLLRNRMRSMRRHMLPDKKKLYDAILCNLIYDLIEKNSMNIIHTYLPIGSEINIYPLIENLINSGKKVIVPKTLGNKKIINLELPSLKGLLPGLYKTMYPKNETEYEGSIDLIIIPGLAFDKNKNRLGNGTGYYDNFLLNHSNTFKLGICYSFQYFSKIPANNYDIKMNKVICEKL